MKIKERGGWDYCIFSIIAASVGLFQAYQNGWEHNNQTLVALMLTVYFITQFKLERILNYLRDMNKG